MWSPWISFQRLTTHAARSHQTLTVPNRVLDPGSALDPHLCSPWIRIRILVHIQSSFLFHIPVLCKNTKYLYEIGNIQPLIWKRIRIKWMRNQNPCSKECEKMRFNWFNCLVWTGSRYRLNCTNQYYQRLPGTVIGSNVVWDLNVVKGNTKISFGPAQFFCKASVFVQKQSLHDIIFCFDFLSCRFVQGCGSGSGSCFGSCMKLSNIFNFLT